jgi:DNA-binding transcriptional regulator YhcF (GntR family)
MGITPNHMNRTLQALRGSGIIASKGKQMIVNDRDRLIDFAGFDPIYLHQQGVRTAKSA